MLIDLLLVVLAVVCAAAIWTEGAARRADARWRAHIRRRTAEDWKGEGGTRGDH